VRPNWQRPALPRREASILELLQGSGIPAPEVVALDPDAETCDVPALLMTRLPGRLDLTPKDMQGWLGQMAAALPRIHGLPADNSIGPYRPYSDPKTVDVPRWSRRQRAWRTVLDLARGPRPRARRCFIHRDYHPANILWSRGKLSGIIDWINASNGPLEMDVAHCRLNLAGLYGLAVADRFLAAYQSLLGRTAADFHPYWDAIDLMDSGFADRGDVFAGWRVIGPPGLTPDLLRARLDEYAVAIAARC